MRKKGKDNILVKLENEPSIVDQDDNVLVINKPSGWITNSASTTKERPVLQTWLKNNFSYETAKNDLKRGGIVHRLDKETSGCIVIAKNDEAFTFLQNEFKQRKVKKSYLALAHGRSKLKEGVIDAPVGRLPWRRDRFGVLPGGREATTKYEVRVFYSNMDETFTLFELKPITGRTHQIRIHLKYINHPIVADTFYAGRKTARNDRKWCPRLFLHASSIKFRNPATLKLVEYKAELPNDLQKCLESLTKTNFKSV